MEEDTIVMGLDGLFDNDFYHEIVSTVGGHIDVAEASKYSKIKRIYIWNQLHNFPCWTRIRLLKLIKNKKTNLNHSYKTLYSLFLDCIVTAK